MSANPSRPWYERSGIPDAILTSKNFKLKQESASIQNESEATKPHTAPMPKCQKCQSVPKFIVVGDFAFCKNVELALKIFACVLNPFVLGGQPYLLHWLDKIKALGDPVSNKILACCGGVPMLI